MSTRGLNILFSGMLAGDPGQGGATWAVLQYVLGLRRLGHEVLVVEPVAGGKLRPEGAALGETAQAKYFREVTRAFELGGRRRWCGRGRGRRSGWITRNCGRRRDGRTCW